MLLTDNNPTNENVFLDHDEFIRVLHELYRVYREPVPANLSQMEFTSINYSLRTAAVVKVTRDKGMSLGLADFNHVVIGRLKTGDVPAFICKCYANHIQSKGIPPNDHRTKDPLHP